MKWRTLSPMLLLPALMMLSLDAHAAWSDWWLNQDQQAQRTLETGDAKRAAQLFNDPRRRAYAESRAGNYADAAKQLAPFSDAQSQYNRGNALAYSGDLKQALDAYDATLKQTPADSTLHRDAQHNRDLVEKQLQQKQNQSQQNKPGNQNDKSKQNEQNKQDGKNNPQQGQNSSGSSSSGNEQQKSNENKDGKGNSSSANASNQQNGKSNPQTGSGQSSSAAGAQSSAAAQQNAQDKEQAQRDAQAALAQQNHGQSGSSSSASSASGMSMAQSSASNAQHQPAAVDVPKPPSEQSLAEQQWLRQIPDDPAGLVRRKFQIEHWLKQRGTQHEDSN